MLAFGSIAASALAAEPATSEPPLPLASQEGAGTAPNPLLDGPPTGALPTPAPAAPSPNATVNLIRLLVAKKILSAEEAQQMTAQAETEAAAARAQAEEAKAAATSPDDVRVTYVPEVVKNEMREQIKADVMAEARQGKLTAPEQAASWTQNISMFGDFRLRAESDMFPSGNDNTGAFPNFNAINTGAPFDVSGTQFAPQNNVDRERFRLKLRARLGWDINLEDGWSAGFRLATGENSSPVTANQGLGVANQGQGGNFSKYAIWLDRAFLKYEVGSDQSSGMSLLFGRFDNPFMSTSIIWEDQIGFDGIAAKGRRELTDGITVFGTGGLFPVFNTDLNFASNQPSKFKSTDKWLYGSQLGVDFKITKDINAKIAASYYDFEGVQGRLSSPFIPLTAQDQGNTDDTRPSFAQKGNTYRAIRDIIPSAINNFGTIDQFQYFGLASKFRVASLDGRVDFSNWEPYQLSLIGQYLDNTAFDGSAINTVAVNNRGANTAAGLPGAFEGSGAAWLLKVQFGKQVFEKLWDWNVAMDYRHVGSDAVIDGFNDNDFGGGGTNVEGFTVGGSVALSKRVRLSLRWLSATQIAGPQFKSDTVWMELNAKF